MSGPVFAAVLLSLALVVLPSSPKRRLVQSGSRRRPIPSLRTRWVVCIGGCGAVVAADLLPLTTLLAVTVLAVTVTLRSRRRRLSRLATDEARSLEAALDVLVGELRVGSHPVNAFSVAAEETGGVVGGALRAVAARARLGADVTTGLHSAARLSGLPAQWNRLAVCWRLASDQGLAIAILMRAAQRDITERQRFSARVKAGMAGARATATILAGLPLLGVVLGQLIGARPLAFLLSGHSGGWLLVIGLSLACGGLLWCDRITDGVVA